jgi:hypothetical protein
MGSSWSELYSESLFFVVVVVVAIIIRVGDILSAFDGKFCILSLYINLVVIMIPEDRERACFQEHVSLHSRTLYLQSRNRTEINPSSLVR